MSLYAFHQASIHERRFVAKFCAALPILSLAFYLGLLGYGLFRSPTLLLYLSAFFNVSAWLWLVSTVLLSIVGVSYASDAMQRASIRSPPRSVQQAVQDVDTETEVSVDKVVHMIVIPNMKEDESMLVETLQSLAEADEAESMCIVLAMEEREPYSFQKGQRIKQRFQQEFAAVTVTVHPTDLQQTHLDDSADQEVPGKASNLKWAVPHGFADFVQNGVVKSRSSVILTVADADCMFHPGYFASVSREFNMLRENPGNDHLWTMYQAPQLPFRNYYDSSVCSRIWGYISSAYEFGGVCSLSFGGTHMTFSGYSLPLQLAMEAGAWDGDVIAEDHHAFLKCFFYSALTSASNTDALGGLGVSACVPHLNVKPIYLPVKATMVAAESYWATCVNRFWQAKRHAQGASELSYAVLAAFDAMVTLPWKSQSFAFYYQVARIIGRLFCMHLLPTCQGIGLFAFSVIWFQHGGRYPLCPKHFHMHYLTTLDHRTGHHLVCGLAGAWVTFVPMVTLTLAVIVANYLFLKVIFLRDKSKNGGRAESMWHAQDGGFPRGGVSAHVLTILQTSFDCTFLFSPVMIPYGFVSNLAAHIDVAINGNRIKYVCASKPKTASYGAFSTTKRLHSSPCLTSASDSTSMATSSSGSPSDCSEEEPLLP